ncbi:FeoB-associated Cys-rich membrane protein [Tenacibaculum insulae]
MQEIITYIIVVLAVFFLIKKFFLKSKKNKGCHTDCDCS